MNFRQIDCFKEISEHALKQLNENYKLLSYRIGQPLSFKNVFSKHIDELQSVLDKKKVCSQVHMVLENRNFKFK